MSLLPEASRKLLHTDVSLFSFTNAASRPLIGLVSDYCNDDRCTAFKEESKTNGADLFTKALDHQEHWDHMGRLMIM